MANVPQASSWWSNRVTVDSIKVCAVIPVYRHVQFVGEVYERVNSLGLHCFIVNDGNSEADSHALHQRFSGKSGVTVLDQYPNGGKGMAAYKGFQAAQNAGYTHALQVDADGQHCIEDYPKLRAELEYDPNALITGIPIYDDSVPKTRLYSRYITHFWVWVETLSFRITDSMCGFRIYPLAGTLKQLDRRVAPRMDFDTHIMVRMFWDGVDVRSVPTKVIYPENGVSNFRLWRDNVRLTGMHTRLVLGMLLRLPLLISRKIKRS